MAVYYSSMPAPVALVHVTCQAGGYWSSRASILGEIVDVCVRLECHRRHDTGERAVVWASREGGRKQAVGRRKEDSGTGSRQGIGGPRATQ